MWDKNLPQYNCVSDNKMYKKFYGLLARHLEILRVTISPAICNILMASDNVRPLIPCPLMASRVSPMWIAPVL